MWPSRMFTLYTTSPLRLPLYVAHLLNHGANNQNIVGHLNGILILLSIADVGIIMILDAYEEVEVV